MCGAFCHCFYTKLIHGVFLSVMKEFSPLRQIEKPLEGLCFLFPLDQLSGRIKLHTKGWTGYMSFFNLNYYFTVPELFLKQTINSSNANANVNSKLKTKASVPLPIQAQPISPQYLMPTNLPPLTMCQSNHPPSIESCPVPNKEGCP